MIGATFADDLGVIIATGVSHARSGPDRPPLMYDEIKPGAIVQHIVSGQIYTVASLGNTMGPTLITKEDGSEWDVDVFEKISRTKLYRILQEKESNAKAKKEN